MAEKTEKQPGVDSNASLEQTPEAVQQQSSSEDVAKLGVQPEPEKSKEKKPSKLKQLWEKTGLDVMTLSMMLKGSLPPTIAIAAFQSRAFQEEYSTLGYLVAISSVLGFCIMPRGKFIQNMIVNIIAICFAAAVNLLALFCVVKAREHSTPPGPTTQTSTYNANASTVAAVWLVFQVYLVNVVKVARPQFQFPAILCSIFVSVSLTYGVVFPDVPTVVSFMKRLLETFLTGFALATGVHFFIFPLSSREVVMKEMTGYLQLMNGALKAHTAYMASLETLDPVKSREEHEAEGKDAKKSKFKKDKKPPGVLETPVLLKFRGLINKLLELHGKLHGDITPAKREIAIGKLESHDLTELWKLMSRIFLPVLGLASTCNTMERWAENHQWAEKEGTEEELEKRHHQLDNLHFLLKQLHEPFAKMTGVLDGAFQHVLITLELVKLEKKKKQDDEESKGNEPAKPGSPGFAAEYKKKVEEYYHSKQQTLRDWCHEHGIELPDDFFESSFIVPEKLSSEAVHYRERHQRQLFFTLYLEYLLWRVSVGMLDLVLYVGKRKQEGAFEKNKVIFPGSKTLYKWFKATWGAEDLTQEDSYTADMGSGGPQSIYLGKNFDKRRDPEHLPPRNTVERIGNAIRGIPKFLRSEESVFGFRVAAATLTVGILCYLRSTQDFFLRNRLLWAMITVAMSMTRTTGQSIMMFSLRLIGTTVAAVATHVIWYIVDGRIPGVIVFLWLWIFMCYYVVLKMPKVVMAGILSLVTALLIVGYELQVKTIGVAIATANGQPAYPTYLLAPYRLAVVACGLAVAFIWTVFPFPISESSVLRKDLSAALYLMSSYYSIVHETITIRIHDFGGDQNQKGTHAYNLTKARDNTFNKLVLLLTNLQANSAFSKFQIRIGGRFPREEYEELISCIRRLLLWLSLASYCSTTFQSTAESSIAENSTWSSDFRELMSNVSVTTNRITSLLSLLSSSLSNAVPLPPYLEMPEPYQFVKRLESIDPDILSIRHVAEPEYSAFAVLQVISQNVNFDIVNLIEHVKRLVGEVDFSFHALETSSTSLDTDSIGSSKDKGKVE